LLILTALAASLVIAACGGSSNSGKTTTSKSAAATSTSKGATSRTAFTTCLKQHGVTSKGFGGGTRTTGAPPAGAGGGGFPGGGGGFAGGNSKFAKAMQACRSKLGSSGFGPGRPGSSAGARHFTPHFSSTELKSYVSCIRKNGYPSMPEPDTSKGAKSVFPVSVEKNAEFQAASKKCQSVLFKASRGAIAPGHSTVTTSSSTTSNA
jgi:hypothetical protein